MARSSITVCTDRRSVNGGWTDTSSEATSAGCQPQPEVLDGADRLRGGRGASSSCRSRAAAGARLGPAPSAMSGSRRRARSEAWRNAASPGRSPCSSNSSDAPPPVETKPTRSPEPELVEGGDRVAAPHDGEAVAVGHGLGHACRSRPRTRSSSNTPMGPFQNTVPAPADRVGERLPAVSGPMSRPAPAVGDVGPDDAHLAVAASVSRSAARAEGDDVGGQQDRGPRPRRGGPAQLSMRPASSSDAPTAWPWAARKVKAMPPPDDQPVHPCRAALAARRACRPPWPRRPRPRTAGPVGQQSPPSTSTSRASRSPAAEGSRAGGPTIEAWARWRDAEGVVHVGVEAVDQPVDEAGVVGLLPGIEAEVLEQLHPRGQLGPVGRGPAPRRTRGRGARWAAPGGCRP